MALPAVLVLGKIDPSRFFCSDAFSWSSYGTASGGVCSSLFPWGSRRTFSGPCERFLCGHPGYNRPRSISAPASTLCRRKSACHTFRTKLPARKPGAPPFGLDEIDSNALPWSSRVGLAKARPDKSESRVDSGSPNPNRLSRNKKRPSPAPPPEKE